MKTYLNKTKHTLQSLIIGSACLLTVSGLHAQMPKPKHFLYANLPRHYNIRWQPAPMNLPPTMPQFKAIVKKAADAWNIAWQAAGKVGTILKLDSEDSPDPCPCMLVGNRICDVKIPFGPPPIPDTLTVQTLICNHTKFYNEVSMCRNQNFLGKSIGNKRIIRSGGIVPPVSIDSVLAITHLQFDKDSCILASDICLATVFMDQNFKCDTINWYSDLTDLNFPYNNNDSLPRGNATKYDLFTVLVHEFGHYLGLDDSNNTNHVMYKALARGTVRRVPTQDEINTIKACKCKCDK